VSTASAAAASFRDRTAWARNLATPVRDYLSNETGGAVALLGATIAALIWANVGGGSYESFWTTKLSINVGGSGISLDLRHWVNEGLMTFFFLVVGLEAKRELDTGELRERKRLTIPVLAALGGMTVPILIFLAFNAGGSASHGWGAAMSTDTAFVLGVLALIAPGGTRLRVTLLTIAVIDDVVALLVITIAYTNHVSTTPLAVGAGLFAVLVALRFAPVSWRREVAVPVGVAIWVAVYKSGIDPVITGLAVGLVTSAYTPARSDLERVTELLRSFREQPTPQLARSAQLGVVSAISANEQLQYRLHPWTSYVIVPLFALANAGIQVDSQLLSDAVTSPITLGILLGYVIGKPVGILTAAFIASRFGLRRALSWPVAFGGATVAGIGFTVSLLIASLAFHGDQLDQAKVGVLATVIVASGLATVVFRIVRRLPTSVRQRQIAATRDDLLDLSEDVDPERDHIRGPADAPVTLIEYGDYQCPYCGQAEVAIRELLDSFGNELRYVWRHLPLTDVHEHAQMAAEAAEAAAEQGEFWRMHDMLLEHQGDLTPPDLTRYARDVGLDVDRFWDALRSRRNAPRIAEDVASADASGVAGTPSFFINGRRHQGAYDVSTLSRAVRTALGRAKAARPAQPIS
jgi:Na+/H+ antiporter NhaA